jgi:secondary thiamine-phosphate synthase enzyme
MAHMAEQYGIIGPYHEGKHTPFVGGGSPFFGEDDDVDMGKRTMLEIPYHAGKLNQVLIQLLRLIPLALTSRLKGECHQNKQAHQNPHVCTIPTPKHAAKIDKKTAETERRAVFKDYFCEILTITSAMTTQLTLKLPPHPRGFHLITSLVEEAADQLPDAGIMHVLIQHTSAGLSLNENADASVRNDFEAFMNHLVPENHPLYTHIYEGSDDMPAHLKSSILGSSVTIPITEGRLNLGTWQGIYLCEFRKQGGSRRLVITIIS